MTYGIKIGDYEFRDVAEVQKAIDAGLINANTVLKHDVNDPSPSIQVPHGQWFDQNTGGLFTRPGSVPDMYHTVVQPDGSQFVNALFSGLTNVLNPEYSVLTGVNDIQGSAAADACSPGPNAGEAKLGIFRQQFGLAKIETQQGDLLQMGSRINNADMDKMLLHPAQVQSVFTPSVINGRNINTTAGLAMFRLGVEIQRQLHNILFTGTQGSAGGAGSMWIEEFDGFDNLVVENPTDVLGNTIAAASSKVVNWASADVSGTLSGDDIVQVISSLCHYVNTLAAQTNLPHGGVIVTHPDLFYNLTAVWPCSYITDRCSVDSSSGERLTASAEATTNMRNEMRNGSFLWVNGMRIPVVQISSVARTATGGGMNSPIYFIPLTALGRKVTYIEGFDFNNADIREFANLAPDASARYDIQNGGLYAVASRQSDFCMEWVFAMRPRLVMRTPWLAWRIENVNYVMPGQHYTRHFDPSDEYFRNGGQYYQVLPTYSD